nr:ABC-2 family transporter protein [Candidatus Levybacteria bacterium]
MKKLLAVLKISFKNIFEYRINFLLGQLRQIILLFTLFYLWKNVFSQNSNLFGFNFREIITYVFLVQIIRSIALDTRTDGISDEIAGNGKFFSYLLRPIGYLKYWLTVDFAYKTVNIFFSFLWLFVAAKLLNINLFMQTNYLNLAFFVISVVFSTLIYFFIMSTTSLWAFWTPQVWGAKFALTLLLEFTSGAFFPLNILPTAFQHILNLTPFPYLVYFPASIYLGKVGFLGMISGILIQSMWVLIFYLLNRIIWQKGLRVYMASGG